MDRMAWPCPRSDDELQIPNSLTHAKSDPPDASFGTGRRRPLQPSLASGAAFIGHDRFIARVSRGEGWTDAWGWVVLLCFSFFF